MFEDMLESRLQVAQQLGASATLLVKPDEDEKVLAEQVMKAFGDDRRPSNRPDIAFECSGSEAARRLGLTVPFTTHFVLAIIRVPSKFWELRN